MLQLKQVSKLFDGKEGVDNVTLTMDRGSITILLGPSGGGKSTLLRLIAGLEKPDSGQLLFDGNALSGQDIIKAHVVGMMFQQFNLFDHLSVLENITLPLQKVLKKTKAEAMQRAEELLEQFGLSACAQKFPVSLSGGQKQRLALARALAMQPHIMCMDEPTSALDPTLTLYVADTITHLAEQGYTVIIATHDVALLDKIDGVIHLIKDGTIVATTTTQTFLQSPDEVPAIKAFVTGAQD